MAVVGRFGLGGLAGPGQAIMLKAVNAYIEAIRKINNYVDPEYGALMLQKKIEDALAETHKKFGAIYLSFPKDLIAKK